MQSFILLHGYGTQEFLQHGHAYTTTTIGHQVFGREILVKRNVVPKGEFYDLPNPILEKHPITIMGSCLVTRNRSSMESVLDQQNTSQQYCRRFIQTQTGVLHMEIQTLYDSRQNSSRLMKIVFQHTRTYYSDSDRHKFRIWRSKAESQSWSNIQPIFSQLSWGWNRHWASVSWSSGMVSSAI